MQVYCWENIGNYENIDKCRFQWEHVGNYGKIWEKTYNHKGAYFPGKIIELNGGFSVAMFEYTRAYGQSFGRW